MTKTVVRVGVGSCGIAAGALAVLHRLSEVLGSREDVVLKPVGCVGLCFHEPLVEIEREGQRWLYGEMDAAGAERVVRDFLATGEAPAEHLVYSTVTEAPENDMLGKQVRVVLRNCGIIDPEKIDEYIARDGYKALEKAVHSMAPEQVIAVVTES
ncbi:MAG TPA: NADH-quinone oxidoreductase subunit F, partial [Synergistaceae bacterium]|nr:NADH-quinone oxidoreductase subunit F [Synergistaceae bacterium]